MSRIRTRVDYWLKVSADDFRDAATEILKALTPTETLLLASMPIVPAEGNECVIGWLAQFARRTQDTQSALSLQAQNMMVCVVARAYKLDQQDVNVVYYGILDGYNPMIFEEMLTERLNKIVRVRA